VILPHVNEKDLPDVPEQVREAMQFHLVRAMPDALEVALERTE
jgi:ATP-dependent Lon protease